MKNFNILLFCFLFIHSFGQKKVELLSFELKDAENKVVVIWETSSEIDVKQFNLYRSVDRTNYFLVGEVPAKNRKYGAKYLHNEHTAGGGIVYYRLDAISNDGKQTVLGNSSIEREDKEKSITVYPNIENGTIRLVSAEQIFSMEMEMIDMLGRVYALSYVNDNTHELTVITGPVQQGPYIVVCYINGTRYVRKKTMFI